MSSQLTIAALASTLSLAALALSSGEVRARGADGDAYVPMLAQLLEAPSPALPALLPR